MRLILLCTALFCNLLLFAQPNPDKGYFKRYIHGSKSNFSTQLKAGFVGINGSRYSLDSPEDQNYFLNPHIQLGLGYQVTHYIGLVLRAGYFHYGGGATHNVPNGFKGNGLEGYLALKHYLLPIGDFDDNLANFNFYGLLGAGTLRVNPRDASSGEHLNNAAGTGHWALQFPVGLGAEYKLNEHFVMGVELSYHYTNTNHIDAALSSERRNNDRYASLGVNVIYRIPKKNFNYQHYLKSITKPF